MDERIKRIDTAVEFLRSALPGFSPEAGIVLGSGLGKFADSIEDATAIPYRDIPGFPVSTAVGHKGNFIAGRIRGRNVIAMQGRFHYYEGYPMDVTTIGIRVMARLGIRTLFVSNAAGAANPGYKVGDLMIIKDHINLLPNPLIGPNLDEFGPRFPDMTCPYDMELIARAESIGAGMGLNLRKGVYLASTGPTYETPAEVRFFRTIGADALGMSTIPEVIVARHCSIKVFGMSVITNISNTDNVSKVLNDGGDVVLQADLAADKMSSLFAEMIAGLPTA